MKLGNQYRGLDAEETSFLNMRKEEQRAKEQAIRDEEQKGLAEYRQYVLDRPIPFTTRRTAVLQLSSQVCWEAVLPCSSMLPGRLDGAGHNLS